ncbi:MAG: S24 family peptidase [Clostridiaceae bacterium]
MFISEQILLYILSLFTICIKAIVIICLKLKGGCMNLSNIVAGQLVMIRRQEQVENGEIALVLVDGEDATIKKFYRTDTVVTLMPHSSNPDYQQRVINLRQDTVKVIGKVVGTFISF